MRVAVVGAGISGLAAAYNLAKAGANVVLYEKEEHLGGHARTVSFDGVDLDLGFMVFNRVTYPNMMEFFEGLEVEMERSDMSFAVSLDGGKGVEWGSRNGLSGLFAQKSNALNPYFWQMIREIVRFKDDVLKSLIHCEVQYCAAEDKHAVLQSLFSLSFFPAFDLVFTFHYSFRSSHTALLAASHYLHDQAIRAEGEER